MSLFVKVYFNPQKYLVYKVYEYIDYFMLICGLFCRHDFFAF